MSAVDPDLSDTHVFSTTDERFEIVSGTLKLKETRYLEVPAGGAVSVTVEVADSGTPTRRLVRNLEIVVQANPTPWQNPTNRWDVTGDGSVSPIDALVIFNELNEPKLADRNRLPVARPMAGRTSNYDVNGDNFVTPNDALVVINFINARAGGESESPFAVSLAVAPHSPVLEELPVRGLLASFLAVGAGSISEPDIESDAEHSVEDHDARDAWLSELGTDPFLELLAGIDDEDSSIDSDWLTLQRSRELEEAVEILVNGLDALQGETL